MAIEYTNQTTPIFQGETGSSENQEDTTTGDDSADKGGEADGDAVAGGDEEGAEE